MTERWVNISFLEELFFGHEQHFFRNHHVNNMWLYFLYHIILSPSITSQSPKMWAHPYTLFLFNTYNDCINRNATPKSVWHQPAAAAARASAYLRRSVRAHEKEFCSPLRSLKRCCVVWDYLLSPSLSVCCRLLHSPPQQSPRSLSFSRRVWHTSQSSEYYIILM